METQIKSKKVLIAAPISGLKQYSLRIWFEWIAAQEYANYDVALCVNGKDFEKLIINLRKTSWKDIHNQFKQPKIMLLPNSDKLTRIQKITYSREKLRRYAVEQGFDYIFWLDTDTIPANKNAIARLMSHEEMVVSGLYFYKNSRQTVVIDKDTHTNFTLERANDLIRQTNCPIVEVWGFGFGCVLMARPVFEKYAFDYNLFGEERTDDFGYCHILEQAGIKRWLDVFVLCKHFDNPENQKKIDALFGSVVKGLK